MSIVKKQMVQLGPVSRAVVVDKKLCEEASIDPDRPVALEANAATQTIAMRQATPAEWRAQAKQRKERRK